MVDAASRRHWVIRRGDQWVVKREGAVRATRVASTQREAIELAKSIARRLNSDVIVQDQRGRIASVIRFDELDAPARQHEQILALLAQWAAEPDDAPAAWWDELDAWLEADRLNLTRETD